MFDDLRNTLLERGEPADEKIKAILDKEMVCEACNEPFGSSCFLYHVIGSVKCYNFYGEERYMKMKKEFQQPSLVLFQRLFEISIILFLFKKN